MYEYVHTTYPYKAGKYDSGLHDYRQSTRQCVTTFAPDGSQLIVSPKDKLASTFPIFDGGGRPKSITEVNILSKTPEGRWEHSNSQKVPFFNMRHMFFTGDNTLMVIAPHYKTKAMQLFTCHIPSTDTGNNESDDHGSYTAPLLSHESGRSLV